MQQRCARIIMIVKTPLWHHQEEAVKRAHERINPVTKVGGLGLFMGVRTGKTLTSLKIAQDFEYKRILVVTKKRAIDVWYDDIMKHTIGTVNIIRLQDGMSTTQKAKALWEVRNNPAYMDGPLFVILNYESVWREPLGDTLMKFGFDLVIVDEAQKIKSSSSKQSRYMSKLGSKTRGRLALTATPFHNSLLDIYGIARFVDKTVFSMSWSAFKNRYAMWGGFNNYVRISYMNEDELREKVDGFSYYVSRDGLFDLPPVTHNTISVQLSKKTYEAIRSFEQDYIVKVNDQDKPVIANNILTMLLRLQQMTNGFAVVGEGENRHTEQIDTAKQEALADLLDSIPLDEPIVIFYKFNNDLTVIRNLVNERGFTFGELNGHNDDLKSWQNGERTVLLVQIESGGAGVELARAAYGIFYSLTSSLGEHTQALGRLHGPNQTRPVNFYYLIAAKTIDEDVVQALLDKQEPIDRILQRLVNQYKS